jgi:hypothetical protein
MIVRLSTLRVFTPFSERMTIKSQESDFILAPASLNLNTEDAARQRRGQKKSPGA